MALSSKAKAHIAAMFSAADRAVAEEMLAGWTEDRSSFAAIRLSNGDLGALRRAMEIGDWRDLWVWAGFDDPHAHERWTPRMVTAEIVATWLAGGEIEDVTFHQGESVQLWRGTVAKGIGTIESLDALEPEPTYTLRLTTGEAVRVQQGRISPAS